LRISLNYQWKHVMGIFFKGKRGRSVESNLRRQN
jgi:hypothetical protein